MSDSHPESREKVLPKTAEAQRLENLEQDLRAELLKQPGSQAAIEARHALQAEVDKLNGSQARVNDVDYSFRVAHQVILNDLNHFNTPDHLPHFPAISISRSGDLYLYSNNKILEDEKRAASLRAHHKALPWNQ